MFSLDYINGNTAIRIHRHDGTKMRKTRHAVLIIRDRCRVRVCLATCNANKPQQILQNDNGGGEALLCSDQGTKHGHIFFLGGMRSPRSLLSVGQSALL
jgi:hypothetical protein